MIEALVFDMDDTLYPEKDFVLSGYRAVAQFLSDSDICDYQSAYSCMAETYATKGKLKVFPALLAKLPHSSIKLADLVDVYRQHTPAICLFPGYLDLLRTLAREYRLGIITDGLPTVQARKVRALGLEGIMDNVIYTWEYGADKEKPHPFSFSLMLEYLQADPASCLFVGDNPDKDCKGAHGAGIKCIQVLYPMENHIHSGIATQETPEFKINTLLQLPQILRLLN
jgi:putative hydrolase of the HAD superfamily